MASQATPLFLHGFELSSHFVDPRPLGTGVTGLVLSAVDQRTGQRVAIKKLSMRDAVTVKHALREVKITQRLHHDNVVRVREVLAPYGWPLPQDPSQLTALYIIQECMETDLAHLLDQGPLPTSKTECSIVHLINGFNIMTNLRKVIRRNTIELSNHYYYNYFIQDKKMQQLFLLVLKSCWILQLY